MDERLNLTWPVLDFHSISYWYDLEKELKPSPSLEGSISFPSPFLSISLTPVSRLTTDHHLVQHSQNTRIHIGHLVVLL